MAQNDGERRMVFDIRGRRRHVVKVVYAILAILMGASLFLVVGPVNIGEIFGASDAANAAEQFEERAVSIERELKKDPDDAALLLALTRQRIYAGNALAEINPQTGEAVPTVESRQQLEQASSAWSDYLKATNEPSPGGAQVVAPALFGLAQTATTGGELEANIKSAADAQQIVADARPSLGSLSTLAIYRYFAFQYGAAAAAGKEAKKFASSKFERENLENQLEEVQRNARNLEKQLVEYNEAVKGQGKESLQNPLGGLGSPTPLSP